MNAVIIFDTQFGNTEKIARAIAEGLPPTISVRLENAANIRKVDTENVELLVVGGPTQRQRITASLQAVLEATPRRSLRGLKAAAFDTRYRMAALLTGSAAQRVARLLDKLGAQLLVPPESFFIERDIPPEGQKRRHEIEQLEPGELDRAAEWAQRVAEAAVSR
jgi:menaquinone-dependent protoporphyrinogen IX oxidase